MYETFKREGIDKPSTALEMLAITLSRRLDNLTDEKNLAPLSRELRLTLEMVRDQPRPADDTVDALASRY